MLEEGKTDERCGPAGFGLDDEGRRAAGRWILACFAVWVALLAASLFLGRMNGDEGFYCVASAKVWQGKLPYRDFAYSQGPVLPYVLGAIPALVRQGSDLPGPSVLGFRLENAALAILAFFLLVRTARRLGGVWAAAIAAALFALNFQTAYLFVIGKTYALAGVFFLGGLSLLAGVGPPGGPGGNRPSSGRLILGAVLLWLAAGTRLSMAAGPAAAVVWGFVRLRGEARATFLFALVLFPVLIFGPFWLADREAFFLNLLGAHLNFVPEPGIVWGNRFAAMGEAFQIWTVPALAGLIALFAGLRPSAPAGPLAGAVFLAVALNFIVPNAAKGDYFAPAVPAVCLLAGLAWGGCAAAIPARCLRWPASAVAAASILAAVLSPASFAALFERSGGRFPMAEHDVLARFVRDAVPRGKPVLSLDAAIPASAGRDVFPGTEFSYFGYFPDVPFATAERFRLSSKAVFLALLRAGRADAAALDDPVPGEPTRMGSIVDRVFTARDLPPDVLTEYYSARYLPEYGPYAHPFRVFLRRGPRPVPMRIPSGTLLGEGVRLAGLEADPLAVRPGSPLRLRTLLHVDRVPRLPLALIVALEQPRSGKSPGAVLWESNPILPGGAAYPTTEWREGEDYFEERDLDLPQGVPPGPAVLRLGLVELKPASGRTVPIPDAAFARVPCSIEERRGRFSLERSEERLRGSDSP